MGRKGQGRKCWFWSPLGAPGAHSGLPLPFNRLLALRWSMTCASLCFNFHVGDAEPARTFNTGNTFLRLRAGPNKLVAVRNTPQNQASLTMLVTGKTCTLSLVNRIKPGAFYSQIKATNTSCTIEQPPFVYVSLSKESSSLRRPAGRQARRAGERATAEAVGGMELVCGLLTGRLAILQA
jgi:hypothetical protein